MGKCISRCFTAKKYPNLSHIAQPQTASRLQMESSASEHKAKQYFPMYHNGQLIQWRDVLVKLRQQLCSNSVSKSMIGHEYCYEVMTKFSECFLTHDEMLQLFEILLIMIGGERELKSNTKSKSVYKQQQHQQMPQLKHIAHRLTRIQQSLRTKHQSSLNCIAFLTQVQQNTKHHHQQHFEQLQFDMSWRQIQSVAAVVRTLCQLDIKAFAILKLYFFVAVGKMAEGKMLSQVEEMYRDALHKLNAKYPPRDLQSVGFKMLRCNLKTVQPPNAHSLTTTLTFPSSSTTPNITQFTKLITESCQNANTDSPFLLQLLKANIPSSSHHTIHVWPMTFSPEQQLSLDSAFNVIMCGQWREQFEELQVKAAKRTAKLQEMSKVDVRVVVNEERMDRRRLFSKIISRQDRLLIDMTKFLTGQCVFTFVDDLIITTNKIVQNINSSFKSCKLIKIEDRLDSLQKDVLLVMKLPQTIATVRLCLERESVTCQFSRKIRGLITNGENGKMMGCSLVGRLFLDGGKQCEQFFTELYERSRHVETVKTNDGHINSIQLKKLTTSMNQFKTRYLDPLRITCTTPRELRQQQLLELTHSLKSVRKTATDSIITTKQSRKDSIIKTQRHNEILLAVEIGDYDKAMIRMDKMKQDQIKNDKALQQLLGDIRCKQDKHRQSLGHYLQAVQLHEKQPDFSPTLPYTTLLQKTSITHQHLHQSHLALQQYNKSLAIRQILCGKTSLECASTLAKIAQLYEQKEQFQDAITLYQKAKELYENPHNFYLCTHECVVAVKYAELLAKLGSVLQGRKLHDKAVECHERCYEIRVNLCGEESLPCAQLLDKLGASFLFKADYSIALQHYFTSLSIIENIHGKHTLPCVLPISGIGSVYQKKGEYEQALKYFRRSLIIIQTYHDPQSVECIRHLNNIIVVYYHQERFEEALAYGLKCLHIQETLKGKDSVDCSGTLFGMSLAYERLQMKHEAYVVCKRAWKIREQSLGEKHYLTLQAEQRLQELTNRYNTNCLGDVFVC